MSESTTPVADLINDLLSQGVPRDQAVTAGQRLERALAVAPTGRASVEDRRKKERDRKARWRSRNPKMSPGQKPVHIDSTTEVKIQIQKKKERKTDSAIVPYVPVTERDDWPDDPGVHFWMKYPPGRLYDKAQVFKMLTKLRQEGFINAEGKRERLTWATLMAGLDRYIASEPGSYAKAPLPWLRGHRWQGDYQIKGVVNGKDRIGGQYDLGFSAIAAAVRAAGSNRGG